MKAVTAALALALAGCTTTPANMEQPENAASFTVDQPYQLTLKRIVEADDNCRIGPLLPVGQVINDVQNYPGLREARIVQGASGVGRQIHEVTTVKEVDGKSVVTVHTKMRRDKRAATLERWATGDPACP